MATIEIRKLDLLARFSQTEFFSHGSKLNYAKLNRFILISFLIHFSVVIFGLVAPLYTKKPLTPPPIKVKYVNTQTSVPLKQRQTPADSLKPKISQKKKTKPPGLLARTSHKTFAKKQYPKQKKHRQIKTTTSKAQNIPSIIHQLRPQVTKKKKGENQQKVPPVSSKFMGSKGTLAMLAITFSTSGIPTVFRFDPVRSLTSEPASSITSIALSGKKRSLMYFSESSAAVFSELLV